jgi:hypothetical protein
MIQKLIRENMEKQKEENISNPHLRWELLKYDIRKSSISYAKEKAKKNEILIMILRVD